MKVGGFMLAEVLYYISNQFTPSNNTLKIQINPPRKDLLAAQVGRKKHALSLN